MKLNADLVFDRLPREFDARISGVKTLELTLGRPLLCEGNENILEAGRLHIIRRDRIPAKASIGKACVILCIGESPRLERFRRQCCVITVDANTDFYRLFNTLQGIFDFYDAWDADLRHIVDGNGEIARLLGCAEKAFENPLYAIDSDFRLLGATESVSVLEGNAQVRPMDGDSLRLGAFDSFLGLHEPTMEEREPLVISLLDQTILCCNLFENDDYKGCVVVHYATRPYRPSDKPLIVHLASILQVALRQLASFEPDGSGSLRLALQGLIEGRPLDLLERSAIDRANNGHRFVCLRMKLSNQLEQLPLGYVRNAIESSFSRCYAFEFHCNSVVALIDTDALGETDRSSSIEEGVAPFTGSMQMKAGVSLPYSDLTSARFLFLQANAALDLGTLFNPSQQVYCYDDYELCNLVINAVGDARLDILYPEGLRRLIQHDNASSASYLETLEALLENNMSITKTAAKLYLHRSTLNERLDRIKRELCLDLDDPNIQLQLRILLKAMKTRQELRSARENTY